MQATSINADQIEKKEKMEPARQQAEKSGDLDDFIFADQEWHCSER